jgi:hypothetical protein
MTPLEQRHVRTLIAALARGQWVDGRCPACHYAQGRGHKCSCQVRVAVKYLTREVGAGDGALEDDDLIVERALLALELAPPTDDEVRRAVIRSAVDAAVAYGGR